MSSLSDSDSVVKLSSDSDSGSRLNPMRVSGAVSQQQRQYDAVFFDLYGTLVDIRTDEDSDVAWSSLYESLCSLVAGTDIDQDDPAIHIPVLRRRFAALFQSISDCQARQASANGQLNSDDDYEPDILPVYQALCADAVAVSRRSISISEIDAAARKAAWTFRRASTHMIRLYEGADDLLRSLQTAGLRVVLVSNAQACYTRPELDMLGLTPLFDRIVISSEEGVRKPSAKLFQRVLQREQLSADRVVMIGNDERCDILGARSAGIDGIYVHTEISPQNDPAVSDHAVQSFAGADYAGILRFLEIR